MKSSSDLDWEFGAIPMIEPEYLGGILATSSDIALLIDQNRPGSMRFRRFVRVQG
jgi:hypothetical protein